MKYCEHIAHTISFNSTDIVPCCTSEGYNPPKYYNSKVEAYSVAENIDVSTRQKQMLEEINGEQYTCYSCSTCMFCKNADEFPEEDMKINSIYLRQWAKDESEEEQLSIPANYNSYEIIKKLFETNKIDTENLIVRIQCVDLSEINELDKYLDLFTQYGVSAIHVSVDNIAYNEKLANLIKECKASINICLDCGTEEIYKQIKGTNNFNTTIENLKKYKEFIQESEYGICIHYVIRTNINDNKKEINNFIELMNNIGIKNIGVRINNEAMNAYITGTNKNISNYKNLITYFYEEAEKYGFILDNDSCIEQNFILENNQKKKGFFSWLFK